MLSEFLKIGPFDLSGYSFFYLLGLAVGGAAIAIGLWMLTRGRRAESLTRQAIQS